MYVLQARIDGARVGDGALRRNRAYPRPSATSVCATSATPEELLRSPTTHSQTRSRLRATNSRRPPE
ncbi:hypothetical protein HS125_06290 [bacterium]|nr:hypothetical protein [bacterium]